MSNIFSHSISFLAGLLAVSIFALTGCSKSASQDGPKANTVTATSASSGACSAAHGHSPATTSASSSDSPGTTAEKSELTKLSPEDRALAEKQRICPVTDEPLGSMGVPVKVTVKGRTVYLCCAGCEDELKSNPDKYLAKLANVSTK